MVGAGLCGVVKVVIMKLITYNIRGLGGRVKKKEVKELVRNQKPDMLCLQETKTEGIDRRLCSMLWEGDDFEWVSKDDVGRSGGLLVIWKRECFELETVFYENNYVGLEGWWGRDRVRVTLVNVYAPCDLGRKKRLWEELENHMFGRGGDRWCIMGDFNSVKDSREKKGVDANNRGDEMQMFGEFIAEIGFIDLPLIGRKYMWYKPDGTTMSRLDRFLITEEWLNSG